MEYRISRYNIYEKIDDGLLIYNTYSGAFIHISNDILKEVNSLIENPNIFQDLKIKEIFIENGFLVDASLNEKERVEREYYREKFNEKNLYLMLLVSEACNFSCPYCYIREKNRNMSREMYDSILRFITATDNEKGIENIKMTFFGGEPLLNHTQNILFLKELNKRFNSKSRIFDMATNGYLLNKERFLEYLNNGLNNFQITIDGNKEMHNSLRFTRNDKDTFETIFNNLRSFKYLENDFNIVIRVNFLNVGDEKYIEFIDDFKKEFGEDTRFIMYFRPVMDYKTKSIDKELNLCSMRDAGLKRLKYTERFYDAFRKKELLNKLSMEFLPIRKNYWCEASLKNYYIIGADGLVYKCNIEICDKKFAIGELSEDKIVKYFDSIYTEEENPYNDPECSECIFLPICQGGCVLGKKRTNLKNCPYDIKMIKNFMMDYHNMSKE